jgi:hypothetical protein
MNLFEDDPTGIDTTSNKEEFIQGSSNKENMPDSIPEDVKPSFLNLFNNIKSSRKEFGSPVETNIDLNQPEEDSQSENNSSNDKSPIDKPDVIDP